jgi:hypothetical protein
MTSVCSTPTALLKNAIMVFLLFASACAGDNEKALSLQRMCTCAAGKGHEKSRGLICVSVPGYVMVSIQFDDPDKREFICPTRRQVLVHHQK